jgi:uncharacterized protein (TIGR02246 family)
MLTQAAGVHVQNTHLQDETAIFQTWLRLSEAWGRGDVERLASLFDADCDHRLLIADGPVRRGRAQLEQTFSRAFARRASAEGRRLHVACTSIRFIKPDVAIVDGTMLFGAGIASHGRRLPGGTEPFTAVMCRAEDGWLIAACRVGTLAPALAG